MIERKESLLPKNVEEPSLSKALLFAGDDRKSRYDAIEHASDCGWIIEVDRLIASMDVLEGETPSKKARQIIQWHDALIKKAKRGRWLWSDKVAELRILKMIFDRDAQALASELDKNGQEHLKEKTVRRNVILGGALMACEAGLATPNILKILSGLPKTPTSISEVLLAFLRAWPIVKSDLPLLSLFFFLSAKSGNKKYSHIALDNSLIDLSVAPEPRQSPAVLNQPRPKVAICISGAVRNGEYALPIIQKNLVEPLGADVFLDVWDIDQRWPGFAGSANVSRTLGANFAKAVPANLRTVEGFSEVFPETAAKLSHLDVVDLKEDALHSLIDATSIRVESDQNFGDDWPFPKEKLITRGTLNQAKMYYKIYRAYQLAKEHEEAEGIEYDYIIRTRPDLLITRPMEWDIIESIGDHEVGLHAMNPFGPDDQFAICTRDTAEHYSTLWRESLRRQRLSPFDAYPGADSHHLLMLWFVFKGIAPRIVKIGKSLGGAVRNARPDVTEELAADFKSGPAAEFVKEPWVTEVKKQLR